MIDNYIQQITFAYVNIDGENELHKLHGDLNMNEHLLRECITQFTHWLKREWVSILKWVFYITRDCNEIVMKYTNSCSRFWFQFNC